MLTLFVAATKIVLLILIVVLAIFTLIRYYIGAKKTLAEVVKQGWKVLTKKKRLVSACSLLFLVIYCGSQYLRSDLLPALTLKYNFQEAAEGETPNKTRLNVSEAFSEEILQETINRGNFPITVDELREELSLESEFDETEIDVEDISNINIATEYELICSPFLAMKGVNPRDFLNLFSDVYYEFFIDTHTENNSILNLDFDDAEGFDYIDLNEYFRVKAEKLYECISGYGNEDSNFRSKTNGETFVSLAEKINNFINIDLERYYSYVLGNGLSNDASAYQTRMDYQNRLQGVEYDKQMATYDVRLETIQMYDEQMARIVLVPTTDEEEEFYMSRTKIGADYFADEADSALETASSIQEDIMHNKYSKQQVSKSDASDAQYEKADQMIEELKKELLDLSEQSQKLSNEYLSDKRDGYIVLNLDNKTFWKKLDLLAGCMYTVLFAVVLSCYIVVVYGKKKIN